MIKFIMLYPLNEVWLIISSLILCVGNKCITQVPFCGLAKTVNVVANYIATQFIGYGS